VVDGRIIIGGSVRADEQTADQPAIFLMKAAQTYGKSVRPQLTLRFYETMNQALM
jgi:hypothetical protein